MGERGSAEVMMVHLQHIWSSLVFVGHFSKTLLSHSAAGQFCATLQYEIKLNTSDLHKLCLCQASSHWLYWVWTARIPAVPECHLLIDYIVHINLMCSIRCRCLDYMIPHHKCLASSIYKHLHLCSLFMGIISYLVSGQKCHIWAGQFIYLSIFNKTLHEDSGATFQSIWRYLKSVLGWNV